MATCPYCKLSENVKIRISSDIPNKCHMNLQGSCIACQKLSDLELKIQKARRNLELLLEERENLAPLVNQHHDPFVHRLPVEIVSRIFVYCRPSEPRADTADTDFHYDARALSKAIFATTRICKNWRCIASGTPELWNILCTNITPANCGPWAEIVPYWLDRSGGLPLHIQFRFNERRANDRFSQAVQSIFSSLVQHARRWQVLDVYVPYTSIPWMAASLSILNQRLDQLEHLKVVISGEFYPDIHEGLHLDASPLLLTYQYGDVNAISTNWDRLTQFSSRTSTIGEIKRLVQNAPHLSFCKLWQVDGDQPPGSPVESSSLSTLIMRCYHEEFWDHFTLPSLGILETSPPYNGSQTDTWYSFRNFIRRSCCNIKCLTLVAHDGTTNKVEIIQPLNLVPDLERLSIKTYNGSSFLAIDADALSSETLSKLTFLRCSGVGRPLLSWLRRFVVAMKSRSLQTVELHCDNGLRGDDVLLGKEMVKSLLDAAEGLEFRMVDIVGQDLLQRLRRFYGF